jgi:GT2 family glycosyltransferase
MASIAVVIVNYNTCEYLRECLENVQLETPSEIIVVDNASSDGSADMVRANFPMVKLHDNMWNVGYGAAANQGIASCTAQYVLLLNSDTRVSAGALQALSAYLDQHREVAIAGPRLVNSNGSLQSSCYVFPGTFAWFLHYEVSGQIIRRVPILGNYQQRKFPHTSPQPVPWVMGAALAIRREAFDAVGGFDESYFMYCEETDLCYRLGQAGWQVHFAPVATITHVGEASTRQHRTEMAVQQVASKLLFYRRHYSKVRYAVLALMIRGTVLARLLFDTYRLHLARNVCHPAGMEADIAAWRRVLLGKWKPAAIRYL